MKQRKQFLNSLGLSSPHLSQHLLRLLLLLVTAIGGVGSSWAADVTIKTLDWSASEWSSHSTICNNALDETINGIKFTRSKTEAGGEYKIDNGILTFTSDGNAQNTNRWIAVPIENINGSITVNIAAVSGKQLQVKYQFVGGSTSISTPTDLTALDKTSSSQSLSFTISNIDSDKGVLYFGQNGSSQNQVGAITINTPSNDAPTVATPVFSLTDGTTVKGTAYGNVSLGTVTSVDGLTLYIRNSSSPITSSAADLAVDNYKQSGISTNISTTGKGDRYVAAVAKDAEGNLSEVAKRHFIVYQYPTISATNVTLDKDATGNSTITATWKEESPNLTYTYNSDRTDVATIAADGTITGVAPGTAIITVTSDEDDTKYFSAASTTFTVTVNSTAKDVTEFRTQGNQTSKLKVGDRGVGYGLQITFPEAFNPTQSNFTISSNHEDIVTAEWRTINNTDNANVKKPAVNLNGIAAGTATITVTFADEAYNSKSVSFDVTVAAPVTINYAKDNGEGTITASTTVKGVSGAKTPSTGELESGNTIPAGLDVKFTATPAEWYLFDNWHDGTNYVGGGVSPYTTTVNADLNLKANFIRYYKIATSATNGTVSLKIKNTETNVTADTQIRKGTALVATAAPVAGYHFVKWQLDGVDQAGGMTLDITKIENFVGATTMTSKTLTAVFEEDATGQTIGAYDFSSSYNRDHSTVTTLAKGQTSHITFVNHSNKEKNWNNWILSVATEEEKAKTSPDLMILRADNWDNLNNGDSRNSATENNFNWDTFNNDMDGATVAMDVTNSGKHIYVNATITTTGGTTYKYSAINNNDRAEDGTAYFCFTVENAYLASLNISEPAKAYELSYGIQREGATGEDHTECGRVEIANAQGLALRKGTFVPLNEVVKYSAIANTGYAFKNWTSGVTAAIRDITVSGGAISEGLVIPRAVFAKEYVSTTWTFEEGNDDGTYTENGMDLVAFGVSWPTDKGYTGLKLDRESAYITFTPNAGGILTIKGTVSKNGTSYLKVTQNGSAATNTALSAAEATYTVVAGQPVTIMRASSEIRINEIIFTPTEDAQLTAPQISVENGVVTFTNPNAGTTLYFKYNRTKEGDISDSNFDGSSTLEVKQIPLSYGVYPANWIQAQVGSGALASAITKYPTEVTVAPPVPVMTKTATAINFTVPTGCFVEFHVGSESAEAIAVYSTTATVDLISATQMTIKGAGSPATDKTVDLATLYVKTVAEYNIENSEKRYIGSDPISVTPEATNVVSATIPTSLEIYVGQNMKISPTVVTKDGTGNTANLHKSWVLVSGSDYLALSETNRTASSITGKKSNTSDNATAVVKAVFDGVESNECTVTIKRTTLAVRADHVALSHNGNEARTVRAIAYNPYTRATVGISGTKAEDDKNLTITTAPKSGSSAFATSSNNIITPKDNSEIGSETWVVTAAPKTDADKACYKAGTAEIEVTCRNYLYAYNTSVPATTPTARPVTNASTDVALNYYAGHNPANCKSAEGDEPLKTWGDKNRGPQEQVIANYSKTVKDGKETIQRPYGRIHGWDGIKNVAEPTMNSLSEQHTRNATPVYNGNSNGTFTYKAYNYDGDHDEFNVPVMGSFYRFYPEKNGTLVAYLCVNGQFSDSEMEKLAKDNSTSTGYASRNTYFLDPYANSMDIQNATVQPTSTIQTGFFYYTLDNCKNTANLTRDIEALLNNWAKWGNDEKNANGELVIPVKSASYAAGKTTYTISDVDWTLFKDLAQDKVGIFHQPIANGDGSFRAITKTYVRCEIPVEKGRVYYVSPTGTKTRMAGVEFIPAGDDPVAENVKFYNGTMQEPKGDTSPYVVAVGKNNFMNPANNGKYYNVTLADRTFKAGQWYSFCMPFDVPEKQIHDIFGADAVTIHFDNVKEENGNLKMNFWSHFYDQIRAGRPIMIKMPATFPDGSTELGNEKVTFKHVKLNMVEPSTLFITDANGWTFKGSYIPVTMEKNAVIINGTKFYHYRDTEKTLAGNRAWIQGPASQSSNARLITTISSFDEDNNDEEATSIEVLLSEMGYNVMKSSDKIYNLNGQMVGQGADINNLPKGVYIVNGKKQIVK